MFIQLDKEIERICQGNLSQPTKHARVPNPLQMLLWSTASMGAGFCGAVGGPDGSGIAMQHGGLAKSTNVVLPPVLSGPLRVLA
jgi:hypothetical protein